MTTLSNRNLIKPFQIFIFFFLSFAATGFAQWFPQSTPVNEDLTAIARNSSGQLLVCGKNGVLLRQQPGQQTWTWLVPADSLDLNAIVFTAGNSGYLAGDSGLVLKTNNGGSSWFRLATGVTTDLHALFFTDSLNGWAAGDSGTVLRTTDGGESWTQDVLPEQKDLYGLWFDAHSGGWCVGDSGAVYHLENGSPVWQKVSMPVSADFRAVAFSDSLTGWIVGRAGAILQTRDAGLTWQVEADEALTDWNAIAFPDEAAIWIAGGGEAQGAFYRTLNGGYSWTQQSGGLFTPFNDLLFVNALEGYAVGDGGRIFKTTSGGMSVINKVFLTSPSDGAVGVDTTVRCDWQQDSEAAEYLLQVAIESDFGSLIFQDSLITPFSTRIPGLAPGQSYYWRVRAVNALGKGPWSDVWTFQTKQPAPRLHAPVNKSGGLERCPTLTWQDLNAPLYHIQIAPEGNFDYISEEQTTTDTFFVPQDLEYDRTYYWRVRVEDEEAPGYWSDEYSFTIRNGLNGWTRQWSGTNGMLCSAAFTEPQTGYAVGTNGTILKTENGGAEWQPITSGVEYHLEAVTFLDDRTGFAVGWGGTILRTDDSGRSWQQVPSGINTMLRSVVFNNRQTGWAVGEKGVILRTGNGGQSWSTFFSNVDYDFYQAFFSNDSCGWIVGGKWSGWEYNPVVFRTTDGGSNWVISTPPGQDAMRAVFFISPQKGWIAGTRGQILRTQNGGVTWSLQQSDKSYELRSLAFTSEEQGWAVGSRGTALVTSDGGQSWQPMETGTGYILRTVVFADADHGWMMGNQGYILKTASGGHVLIPSPEEPRNHAPGQPVNLRVRWNDVPEAAGYHLQVARDPSFTDLLYENGNILTTVVELPQLEPNQTYYWRVRSAYRNQSSGWSPVWNFHTAGAWQEQFSTTNRDLYGVDFRDAFNGLAVGEDGTILITADGGKIWKQTQIAIHVNLYDVAWQSLTAAWAVGDSGRVWYTSDGGRTWQKKYAGESFRFRHILVREGNQIWITGVREISGGMSSGAVLLTSADRGASWQLRTVSKLEMVHDLAFTKSGAAFLIGAGSQTGLLKSWDQGATWQPVPVNGEKEFTAIRFNDRDEGYLLSANGSLYLTEDDGESWEKIGRQPVTGAANKLALLGSGKMLTVGKGIWRSANEGVQWQALFPDSTFNDCDFVDDAKGWIVGPKGLILQTTTGGAIATSVPTEKETLPENFVLEQNFPNPFNPKTVIRYRLPAAGRVELSVYSVLGQKVATLVTGKQKAGVHTVQWNGSNMASGVYFYRLKTNAGVVLTKKMILLR